VIVLGFDTATPATAVGLRLADGATLEAHDIPKPGERPGHATRLLPLANQLLAQAGIDWGSLQRIAVGVGPGTFTGLRVGVATARGLAQSLALDLLGVSSLHALAHRALHDPSAGEGAGVLAAIDARRGEAFLGGWSAEGELLAPRALAPEDFAGLLLRPKHKPGLDPHEDEQGLAHHALRLAIGDGAVRYRSHLQALDIEVPPDTSPLHRVSGAAICELACPRKGALHVEPAAPEAVLPDYLRQPDAEIALQGASG
jgi:tRNA threonylcarbamoyladenosine biosynthesis protein TsaB